MYYDGEGVAYDLDESTEWLRKAAEQGHADSQFRLALILSAEYDTPVTKELAAFWMECAAKRGHVKARAILDHLSSIPGSNDI